MNEELITALETLEAKENTPQTVEFSVREDFVEKLPMILSNVAEIKEWAEKQTAKDKTLVLQSEEDFDTARKRCAEINRVVLSIDAKRREVKKQYVAPYETFETALKEVTSVLTEAKDNLWGQITRAEAEKKHEIEAVYRKYFEIKAEEKGIAEYRTWQNVFNPKWLNKGVKADKVYAEIDALTDNTAREIDTIKKLESEFVVALLEKYKSGENILAVLDYNNRLKAQKELQKAVEEKAAEERAERTATAPHETVIETEASAGEEPVMEIAFKVSATRRQLALLKDFLIKNNIKYGKA